MKNIKIFAFLAIFLLSAAVSTAWAVDVTLTYKIEVQGTLPVAHIYNAATGEEVASWDHGIKTLWPANEGHTMNDDYKITFKPNQGLDKTDKNENNKSTSTTAFRTEKETDFQVKVGKEGFYLKSVTFKENNTVKASSSNIAPNSTSIGVSVPKNKFFNYITVVLTVDAYTVSVPENLTISDAFATISGVNYYKAGETVTFGFSGSGSVVYFVNGERIEGNSVTVGKKDLKVEIGIPYIDENGKTQIREPGEYTVLTEDNKPNEDGVINLNGGWYVVQGKVKYASQVKFSGEAHLILADGAEMVIESESMYGIYALNNLTIYGQSGQGGILNATANGKIGSGIYGKGTVTIIGGTVEASGTNGYGIYGDKGVTISGGTVTATSTNGSGIYGYNGVTISGGSVEAVGKDGIDGSKGVTISGGKVTATGIGFYGIHSSIGNITLGWTNSTDFIKASSYYYSNKGSVQIAEGKSFKDEKGIVYSGTLTGEQLSAIKGNRLEPCYAVTFDAQNGDDPIMLLTTFDENGVAHVKKPNDPIRSGFTFEGWFTATDGNTEFDFSAAITGNTTAYAKWKENALVEYIDENGAPKSVTDYTVLTEDNKPNKDGVIELPGGWYVVQGKVKYSNQVKFSGEAHLILADGAEMVIESKSRFVIYALNNLTIYGQSGQGGILNVTAKASFCFGIYSSNGRITISGGSVTATGTNYPGIYGDKGVSISGGKVTATGSNSNDGISSYSGDITIIGGKVTATGSNYGISSYSGNITLGWTNSTDYIYANGYFLRDYKKNVSIAEGKSFKDEKGYVYRGTLTKGQVSDFKGQKLEPFEGVSVSFVDNFSGASDVFAEIAVDGEGHVSAPSKHPFHSGYAFVGWFTSPEGGSEFDFTVKVTENTTAYAHWNENTPVEYIDENGGTNETKNYILLTNDIYVEDDLLGGWYVVQGKVKYSSQVKFSGEAHLILADGAKMEIETEGEYGIYASKNLTIYGQNGQSGILNAIANGSSGNGIYSRFGDITIIGGKVTATGSSFGIYGSNGVTISGGSVTATGSNYGIYGYDGVSISGGSVTATGENGVGIYSVFGNIMISGGSVMATGKNGYGISSWDGNITLGWTNSTDFIYASSYYCEKGSVSIAEGKSFKDEKDIVYSGTLTDENLEYIKNKTLTPPKPFPDNIVIANISGATYTGDSIRPEPVVTIGENVLELGKDYTLAYKDNLNASDTAKVIVKGAGKYYGEVQKLFTIAKVPLTVTAKDKSIVYGNEPANDGVEYSGFIGEENESVLGGELSYSYSYKKLDKVGKYTITPSGLTAGNYEITFAAGTLTVEIAAVSVEAPVAEEKLVYSGKAQELVTAGKTNFGMLLYSLDGENYGAEIPAATDAKTYTVYYKVEGSDNWNALETKTIEVSIAKADISVEALAAKEKLVYSGKAQELVTAGNANFGALLYSLDGEKYSAEIPAATDAKTYTVYYKVAESDNWNAFEAKTIEVVIAKAPLTITAKDKTIAYGDEPANDGVEYSGFIGEENESVLGGKLTYSYDYKKLDKVGKYTITPSGLTASNYEISFVAGALNVEPKATHYAAVQVLEDENGKRAEIDGEYGEGDGIVITEPLEVASVEFSRDFSTQGYSTIVLPFDVNTSKLSGVDSVLSFARIVKEQGEMAVGMKVVWEASASHVDLKANTPYMVKMTGAKLGIDGGVTLLPTEAAVTKSDAQNDGWEFRGTYAYKSWQEGDEDLCRVYGFAGGSNDEVSEGDFVKFTAGASLRPLRAYLINTNRTCGAPKMARAYGDYVLGAKSSIDDLPESMKVVIVGEDGYTTVIGHFNTRTGEFTTGTSVRKFDLKGRAVRGTPSARGAYYGKRVKK
ncbi:Listeria/Bacterioides repeat-containing protein [Fibrobacter sp. UWB16]|uniref:MBG domain-containing protein n=1 Tax=Fibrobacter sp. UWB16 TaxID=1945874 RepID=UPI000BDCE2A6|nr:MBG domain-containing protein [Fibrobacter sp. UWB16]SOD13432.1 Listeria/Bacterioides repeat-containing protein [Fibrobacter sp. UWB16]